MCRQADCTGLAKSRQIHKSYRCDTFRAGCLDSLNWSTGLDRSIQREDEASVYAWVE